MRQRAVPATPVLARKRASLDASAWVVPARCERADALMDMRAAWPPLHAGGAPTFEQASEADFEALLQIRLVAMRSSLEQIGRFDPLRARQRLAASWDPSMTQHILCDGQRVGFFMLRRTDHALVLQHLYLMPFAQGRGVGSAVMRTLIDESNWAGLPLRVTALRGSPANAFYLKHGFVRCSADEYDLGYVRAPDRGAGARAATTSPKG